MEEYLLKVLAIAVCVLLFGFAIFIHEFGHFLVAKLLGMRVDVFSIGFGQAVWKKKIGDCEYRVAWIPLGGYVSIPSVDPEGTKQLQGTADAAAPQVDAAPWKRILVGVAGPTGNFVLAVALAFALAAVPGAKFGELSAEVGMVPDEGPAFEAGVKAGDVVLSIDGNPVSNWGAVRNETQLAGGRTVPMVVRRGAEEVTLSVTPARDDVTGGYYLLMFATTNGVNAAQWMTVRDPLKQLAWDAGQIFRVLKALVTPKESAAAANALGGVETIGTVLYKQVRKDKWDAVGFLRFLNVNLGMLNLLPIPVLDGGLILFALIELLFRRKLNEKFVKCVTVFFMVLLVASMAFLIVRGTVRIVRMNIAQKTMRAKAADTNAVDAASAAKPEGGK